MPGGCPSSLAGRWADADVARLPPVSSEPIRVLIAEDEALIRLDLKEMLEEEGYSVVAEVGDGQQAVDRATELRPDLVILDIQMPVLDGLSAAEQIASARIAPVIVLTAFSQRELVERARDAGAMAYLVKPFSKNDLVPAIEVARGPVRRDDGPGRRGAHARGAAGDPQGRREGQGPAHGGAGHHRGGGVPLDPADGDEPADVDEGARAVDPRAPATPASRGHRRLTPADRRPGCAARCRAVPAMSGVAAAGHDLITVAARRRLRACRRRLGSPH